MGKLKSVQKLGGKIGGYLIKKHGRLVVKGRCSICNSEIEEYV